ncbi:hypothetical protein DFH09DRAFT_1398932 [Mycena vulgaris]|nr:hypothetical protein DFH09DRAFT_1398932 [Mycena vulgaris]
MEAHPLQLHAPLAQRTNTGIFFCAIVEVVPIYLLIYNNLPIRELPLRSHHLLVSPSRVDHHGLLLPREVELCGGDQPEIRRAFVRARVLPHHATLHSLSTEEVGGLPRRRKGASFLRRLAMSTAGACPSNRTTRAAALRISLPPWSAVHKKLDGANCSCALTAWTSSSAPGSPAQEVELWGASSVGLPRHRHVVLFAVVAKPWSTGRRKESAIRLAGCDDRVGTSVPRVECAGTGSALRAFPNPSSFRGTGAAMSSQAIPLPSFAFSPQQPRAD